MKEILSIIRTSESFKAEVKDIWFLDKETILNEYANEKISLAYKKLHDKFLLGSQYEWFALLCDALDIQVECGLEMSDRSKALSAIKESGCRLCKYSDDELDERLCIDKSCETDEIQLVFGHFILGITDLSKKDAENIAREKDWIDIMKLTWFCHNPVFGKPCGLCNPCKDAMNEEMEWRMPEISQWRYKYLNHPFGRKICALARRVERATSKK